MYKPLADEIRPVELSDVVGQRHILGEDGMLRRIIESGNIPNMIFYGPSGTGKTTVARIIAQRTNRTLRKLNATTAGIADIKAIIDELDLRRPIYRKTAAYGHFGRELPEFTWEKTNKAEALREACGL